MEERGAGRAVDWKIRLKRRREVKKYQRGKRERERNHFEDWGRREGSPPDLQ